MEHWFSNLEGLLKQNAGSKYGMGPENMHSRTTPKHGTSLGELTGLEVKSSISYFSSS